MTTHKTFKQRVRARSAKTGESYTTARQQLIDKADRRPPAPPATPEPTTSQLAMPGPDPALLPTPDEAVRQATGRGWDDWFTLLDDWGATGRGHTEIARWLVTEHDVGGWWAQSLTVGYERARGIRAKHQMATGFAVTVSKTVSVPVERLRAAFVDAGTRRRWQPDTSMRKRPGRSESTARFDWPDPASVVAVTFDPKGETKSVVAVQHQRLPDARAAERQKAYWRQALVALKESLEKG